MEEETMDVLEKFGLSKTEAKLYLALLSAGESTANSLVIKTAADRRLAYDSLEKLVKKGLVSWVEKNHKKHYAPANPSRFLEIGRERKEDISRIEDRFKMLLPELEARFMTKKTEREIVVLDGLEGIKTAMADQLKAGKTIYVMGGSGEVFEYLNYFMPQFVRKRAELKIPIRILYNEDGRKKGFPSAPLSEIKYIPTEHCSPTTVAIYGDYVTMSIYSVEPLAIQIRSREIAQSFMSYFNLMWNVAKK